MKLDLSTIINSDDKDEEEANEGAIEVRTNIVSTEEVVPEVTAKAETAIEETIPKVIADAEAMTDKAIEDFEATQTSAPRSDHVFFLLFCTQAWPQFCVDF